MIKKIMKLSKVFIKDYFQNLYIFNKNTKKINKKSIFTWFILIVMGMMTYLSFNLINFLDKSGQAILFLKIYFPILAIIFMFQGILVCCNVFFFSKDLEYILPLPVKPIELLIAKFNNVITITYGMEAMFLLIPLIMYGIILAKSLFYYLIMILVLIIFPVFLIFMVSIIMLIVMQLTKFIKNKDIFQILVVAILTSIMTIIIMLSINAIFSDNIINLKINENSVVEEASFDTNIFNSKLDKINNYFMIINPCIKMLNDINKIEIILELFKVVILNIISFIIFIFFGKILYLKNLLKNVEYINKKKNKRKKIINKYKKNNIKKSYIKNEFKKIIKNPTFFIQCIFQYIFIIIIVLLIINLFFPMILKYFESKDIINQLGINNFTLQSICIILGILQIIYMFGNLSSTAISRDGKNAVVNKYIPISLYKQFLWKNIPQILFNSFAIIGMIIVVAINIPKVNIIYYFVSVLLAILLNIINSFFMMIIDLKKPNLDWITETSVLKDNSKKIYQYVMTIVIILMLSYFTKIFEDINIMISLFSILGIFIIVICLFIFYIKININKLFNKIN